MNDWAAWKERSKDKRASNRKQSAIALTNAGISYIVHNGGAHLVVEDRVDFWPGTGKYIDRKTKRRGRGVFNLIKMVRSWQ